MEPWRTYIGEVKLKSVTVTKKSTQICMILLCDHIVFATKNKSKFKGKLELIGCWIVNVADTEGLFFPSSSSLFISLYSLFPLYFSSFLFPLYSSSLFPLYSLFIPHSSSLHSSLFLFRLFPLYSSSLLPSFLFPLHSCSFLFPLYSSSFLIPLPFIPLYSSSVCSLFIPLPSSLPFPPSFLFSLLIFFVPFSPFSPLPYPLYTLPTVLVIPSPSRLSLFVSLCTFPSFPSLLSPFLFLCLFPSLSSLYLLLLLSNLPLLPPV